MRNHRKANTGVAVAVFGILAGASVLTSHPIQAAQNLNAGYVINKMTPTERGGFLAGIIEGLAYARFLKERPSETGMRCIQNWYYKSTKEQLPKIRQLFERHHEKQPAVLLYVLIKKECGA